MQWKLVLRACAELKNMNKNVYMLTGDNEASAKIIANEIGIDNVRVIWHLNKN